MPKFGRKWFLKCASLAYVILNTAHNDGLSLLAEVDIADGEALVDEFERPAGRRLALLLLAHMIIHVISTLEPWQRLVSRGPSPREGSGPRETRQRQCAR